MRLSLRKTFGRCLFFLLFITFVNRSAAQIPVSINIGADTVLPLKQSEPTSLTLTANIVGVPVAVLWSRISGDNGVSIGSTSALTTTITGLKEGSYSFRCDVLNVLGISILNDVINIRVVDYQKKNRIPCRTGPPVTWTLSATNTYDLVRPYLRRDGMDIRGGDTIKINRNPNNGGVYARFYLGDFGGDEGCPVIVVPNGQIVEIGGASHRWHLGKNNNSTSDSNFVNHVVLDGTYLRSKGIPYGFHSTGTSWGISTSMVTDLEIKGCLFKNNSLGIQMKIYSDSTYPWTVYDNFIMKNIKIHDNYFKNIRTNEGMYVGHTSPSGSTQAGNNGPTPRMDSAFIYDNIIDSSGWDAMQTSSARYVEMHDNIILHSSTLNASSQNWGMLMGGNCTGKIYNNIVYGGTSGTVGSLGYGQVDIFYNFIDSTTGYGMYVNGITSYILEANIPGKLPPLRLNVRDNIISRTESQAIFHSNNDRRALPGTIQNNYIVEPTRSLTQMIVTNASDAITANSLIRSFPVTVRSIGSPDTGPMIQVTQGAASATFSKSKDAIDWLFNRISGGPLPNTPPVANAGTDFTVSLPNNASLNGTSSNDPDGTIVSYSWSKIAGPTQFSIANGTSSQATVSGLAIGVYQFRLLVTDNDGAQDADTVTVTVNAAPPPPVNIPPVANAGVDFTVTLPNNASLNGTSSTDPDGTIASYSWSKIAGPTQFSIANGTSSQATVSGLAVGVYQFRLSVTDNGGAQDADTVVVTVNGTPPPPPPVNIPPVANAGVDFTVTLPNNASLNGTSSTDPDGTIASYSWSKIAGPTQFSIANGTSSQATVSGLAVGVYQFRLSVTDNGGAQDADTVVVTVNGTPPPPANIPPVANAGTDRILTLPNNSVTLTGTGSTDPDGIIASYNWTKIAGPTQYSIANATSSQPSVSGLSAGVYQFRLVVQDNAGAQDADTVMVTVNTAPPPSNIPPVANAGPDQVLTLPNNTASLNGTGSTDTDGVINSYSWTKIAGPSQFSIMNGTASQATATNLTAGVYAFELLVTDNSGATDRDTMVVSVINATNLAPVVNAGNDTVLLLPANIANLRGSASDPDGNIVQYSWRHISGNGRYTFVSANSAQTGVTDLEEGVYGFELRATDNAGAWSTDTVTVTVRSSVSSRASVYPNPASDYVNLKIDANTYANPTSIVIYDMSRHTVHQEQFMRSQPSVIRRLNLAKLPAGIYMIVVTVDINNQVTCKLLKK